MTPLTREHSGARVGERETSSAPGGPAAGIEGPPAGGSALGRCVGDAARFLDADWARRPHRLTPPDPAGFADLLSLGAVDHILTTTSPRTPSFRLVEGGRPLPPGSYTRSGRVGGRPYSGAADVARVMSAFAGGATVVLQSLHRSWAPLAQFCRDLELTFTHPVQANAYLTPAGANALAPHHDTHDVFVMQVHGTKHWAVRQPVVEAPLPRHRSRQEAAGAQPLLFETDLAPGDCLYLPRGFVHSATAQQGVSLHITIGVHAVTAYDVLTALVDSAAEHPAFRAPLPAGFATQGRAGGGKALVEAVESCVAEALSWLPGVDAASVAEAMRRRFWAQRLPLLEGQLLQLAELDHLDDDTVVRRRPGAICEPGGQGDGDDRLRLILGDRELVLPREVEPALRRLLDGTERPVSALDDLLDGPSRLVLVRRLVREGVIEVAGVG